MYMYIYETLKRKKIVKEKRKRMKSIEYTYIHTYIYIYIYIEYTMSEFEIAFYLQRNLGCTLQSQNLWQRKNGWEGTGN